MPTVTAEANVLVGTEYSHYDGLLPAGRPKEGFPLNHGDTFICPIEVILARGSIDGADPDASNRNPNSKEPWSWNHLSWDDLLNEKRSDYSYPDVVDSLREFGFIRPVTIDIRDDTVAWQYGDGHHRLAAAIDLGWHHVVVQAAAWAVCSADSGDWNGAERIPLANFRGGGSAPYVGGLRYESDPEDDQTSGTYNPEQIWCTACQEWH